MSLDLDKLEQFQSLESSRDNPAVELFSYFKTLAQDPRCDKNRERHLAAIDQGDKSVLYFHITDPDRRTGRVALARIGYLDGNNDEHIKLVLVAKEDSIAPSILGNPDPELVQRVRDRFRAEFKNKS